MSQLQQQYQQPTITIDQFYRLQHRAKTEIVNLIDASIPNKDQNRALKSLVDGIFENMSFEADKSPNVVIKNDSGRSILSKINSVE